MRKCSLGYYKENPNIKLQSVTNLLISVNQLQREDVIVKKVSHGLFNTTFIMLETKPKAHTCPKCSNLTSRIHDYRLQRIKHIPFRVNFPKHSLVNVAKNHQSVIDILPDSKQSHLCEYFLSMPRKDQLKTKFFIMDM